MHFGFTLESSDIDLWDMDTHLDLLVTDIPSKHFLIFSKTSWQRLQDMSSRRFQDMKST